jgi:phage-related baseplate assembly protein
MSNGIERPLFGFDLSTVPDIDFAQKDVSIIESQVVTNYENYWYLITRINKTLGRADPVRLFLLNVVYQLCVQRSIIDSTGKQNLIKYARGDNLDNIGARWGPTRGKRLPATSASCMLRFSLSAALPIEAVIPYNTLAQSNSEIQFGTIREVIIPVGQLTVDVPATAVQVGSLGNNLLPGQINQLVSWNAPFLIQVTNITETSGGSERETDDRFRMRIWMAPESFSVAGPYGAYEYWTSSANSNITDVSIWSAPEVAGQVFVYFLMEGGRLPTQDEREQVYAVVNADDIRPLTDWVHAGIGEDEGGAPEVVLYHIDATFYIDQAKAVFAEQIRAGVETAFERYKIWQRSEIGRDINPSVMIQMLMNAGAKRISLRSPNLDPFNPNNIITPRQVAREDGTSELIYGGLEKKDIEEPLIKPLLK